MGSSYEIVSHSIFRLHLYLVGKKAAYIQDSMRYFSLSSSDWHSRFVYYWHTCTLGCMCRSRRLMEKPAWRCGFPPSGCIVLLSSMAPRSKRIKKQALSIFIIRHQVLCQVQPSCSAALHHPQSLLTLIDSLKSTTLVLAWDRQEGGEWEREGRDTEENIHKATKHKKQS